MRGGVGASEGSPVRGRGLVDRDAPAGAGVITSSHAAYRADGARAGKLCALYPHAAAGAAADIAASAVGDNGAVQRQRAASDKMHRAGAVRSHVVYAAAVVNRMAHRAMDLAYGIGSRSRLATVAAIVAAGAGPIAILVFDERISLLRHVDRRTGGDGEVAASLKHHGMVARGVGAKVGNGCVVAERDVARDCVGGVAGLEEQRHRSVVASRARDGKRGNAERRVDGDGKGRPRALAIHGVGDGRRVARRAWIAGRRRPVGRLLPVSVRAAVPDVVSRPRTRRAQRDSGKSNTTHEFLDHVHLDPPAGFLVCKRQGK